jgi:hypothetical protein
MGHKTDEEIELALKILGIKQACCHHCGSRRDVHRVGSYLIHNSKSPVAFRYKCTSCGNAGILELFETKNGAYVWKDVTPEWIEWARKCGADFRPWGAPAPAPPDQLIFLAATCLWVVQARCFSPLHSVLFQTFFEAVFT